MILTDNVFFKGTNNLSSQDFSLDVRTFMNYTGSLSHYNQFVNTCLLCFSKEFNNTEKNSFDQITLYTKSLMRKTASAISTDITVYYMSHILRSIQETKARQWASNDRAVNITLIDWSNVGKDRRQELVAQLKENNRELPYARTLLTTQPTVDVRAFQLENAHEILILTNHLADSTVQFLPMLIANTLHVTVAESIVSLVLQADEAKVAAIITPVLQKLEEAVVYRKVLEQLPNITNLINYRHNVANMKTLLERILNDYNRELQQLSAIGVKMTQMQKDILYAENKKATTDDLIEYIKAYGLNYIHQIERYNDNKTYLCLKVPMLYWYNEDYEILAANKNDNELSNYSAAFLDFLEEIFIKRTYTIITYTAVTLALDTAELRFSCNKDTTDYLASYMIHHPHTYHYNCWGDNERLLKQSLIEDDAIGFWNGLITTLSSINLADGPVFKRYIADLNKCALNESHNNARLRTKDGKELTIRQAYKEFLVEPTATVTSEPVETTDSVPPVPTVLDPVDLIF